MLNIGKISAFIILTYINLPLFSQGEIVEEPKILYKNERTFAGFITSNGFGGDFRYGKRVNARQQILYQVDFMILKHLKEIKLSNNYFTRQNFVFGKINNFFEFKGFIGRQHEIFRKNDRGGISIRYNYNIGPVIGILKPIYYEIIDSIDIPRQILYTSIDKFSITTHQADDIIGRATFFKGFKELSIIPGGSIKTGVSFEYSKEDIKINALEVGIGLDVFPKKIPILASNRNSNYFVNLIVSYRFGKVIDISEAARSKTWKEKRAEMKVSRKIMKDQKKDAGELKNF